MPVLRADQEKRTDSRCRRWLWLLAGSPTLVLLLLLVPVVHPVALRAGDRWLILKTKWDPIASETHGLGGQDAALPRRVGLKDVGEFDTRGPAHARWLRVGAWIYTVAWFQGRRVQ